MGTNGIVCYCVLNHEIHDILWDCYIVVVGAHIGEKEGEGRSCKQDCGGQPCLRIPKPKLECVMFFSELRNLPIRMISEFTQDII